MSRGTKSARIQVAREEERRVSQWTFLEEAMRALVQWSKYRIHVLLGSVFGIGWYLMYDRPNLVEQRDEAHTELEKTKAELGQTRLELRFLRGLRLEDLRTEQPSQIFNITYIAVDSGSGKLSELQNPRLRSP